MHLRRVTVQAEISETPSKPPSAITVSAPPQALPLPAGRLKVSSGERTSSRGKLRSNAAKHRRMHVMPAGARKAIEKRGSNPANFQKSRRYGRPDHNGAKLVVDQARMIKGCSALLNQVALVGRY